MRDLDSTLCLATETWIEVNAFLFDISLFLMSSFYGNSVIILTFYNGKFRISTSPNPVLFSARGRSLQVSTPTPLIAARVQLPVRSPYFNLDGQHCGDFGTVVRSCDDE